MIRIDAEVAEMSLQDITDTLPVLLNEQNQWGKLWVGSNDDHTVTYAKNKQTAISDRIQEMLEKRKTLK